ncbi:MAG: hypothetical protein PHN56_07320, partial [Candidatus Nanoarchaeia archaeon]|nr:hypothetical protein [Candidatus Nanoarchaeia archaeon]
EIANKTNINQIKVSAGNSVIYSNYNRDIRETIEEDQQECLYLDGKTKLTLPNSQNKFETGPFAVYVEYKPEITNDTQEIIGHYNWEILQDKTKIRFVVGKMDNKTGPSYTLTYNINKDFFNRTHSILGIYNPTQEVNESGYIVLFVDGKFAGKKEFKNERIWTDYNGVQNLSLGKYGKYPYYHGSICNAKFVYKKIKPKETKEMQFISNNETIRIPIIGNGFLKKVEIKIEKR